MTLILKLDLDMVKMYLYIKNEVPSISHSKLQPEQTHGQTDRHTDPTEIITYPHTRMVTNNSYTSVIHFMLVCLISTISHYQVKLIRNYTSPFLVHLLNKRSEGHRLCA